MSYPPSENTCISFNENCSSQFLLFFNRYFPNSDKYHLLAQVLKPCFSLLYDARFSLNNHFYPLIRPSSSQRHRNINFAIKNTNSNLILVLIASIVRLFILFILRKKFFTIKIPKLDYSSPTALRKVITTLSSNRPTTSLFDKSRNYFSALVLRLIFWIVSHPISFIPCLYLNLFAFSIYLRTPCYYLFFNRRWSNYLNSLVEHQLRRDFKNLSSLLSYLEVSEYFSTGWFSSNSMILFSCLNHLNISSTVRAHGHLSQTTLAYFFPVLSTNFIVNTEEEAYRIKVISRDKANVNYRFTNLFASQESLKSNLASYPSIILALSAPHCLHDSVIFSKYKLLVDKLLHQGFSVSYKAHHQATKSEKLLLSLNNLIPPLTPNVLSYHSTDSASTSIMLGSSSTVLIDAKALGIPAYEILDFHTNISPLIKSAPCTTVNTLIDILPPSLLTS